MLISSSKKMTDIVAFSEKVASYPVNVIILGETGCGKELIARHIHELSRCSGKYMSINCTAVPGELLESELFGYRKGAFTGAYKTKIGIMEDVYGGSLLLDEIGDMPLHLQPKLLRVLDTKKFLPLGGTKAIDFNARVIATTNKNLLDQKIFRLDLYFRLATVVINLPPLRDRPEDLYSLVGYFLGQIQEEFELKEFPEITDESIYKLLFEYSWPGNIRELQNVLKRAIISGDGVLKKEIIEDIIKTTSKFFSK